MRKTLNIRGRDVSVKLLAALIVCSLIGVTAALVSIGTIDVSYIITPTTSQAASLDPNPLSLDLGSIPSGSTGSKDFGKVATLSLSDGYEITFTLDTTTVTDFTSFSVYVYLHELGTTSYSYTFYFTESPYWNSDTWTVAAGDYDVEVEISYTAGSVTSETAGTVTIDVSYPG